MALWPLDVYGLDQPFTVPEHWERDGSGAGAGERDVVWITPKLTAEQVKLAVKVLDTPAVTFVIDAEKPDWIYQIPGDQFSVFMEASNAWDEYTRELLDGKDVKPPKKKDFNKQIA